MALEEVAYCLGCKRGAPGGLDILLRGCAKPETVCRFGQKVFKPWTEIPVDDRPVLLEAALSSIAEAALELEGKRESAAHLRSLWWETFDRWKELGRG